MASESGMLILGVLIGIISYILLYIGKGIQKLAIEKFKGVQREKTIEKKEKTKKQGKNSILWILGTILTTSFMFVQWIPLYFGTPMNVIVPFEGFGLIVLLIFSYFVLKEKIMKVEIVGASLIIVGIILVTVFLQDSNEELIKENVNFSMFWWLLGGIFGGELTFVICTTLLIKNQKWSGITLAVLAGTCMAWQSLAKSITRVEGLGVIFTIVVFITAAATLGFTQWAFTKIQANLVVPIFSSLSITLTVVLGNFVINELLQPIQIVGIGIIVVGVVLISAFNKKKNLEKEVKEQ